MKAKLSTLLILLICIFSTNLSAQPTSYQNEGANWYFGAYAGLTWTTMQANFNPTPLMNGALYTSEGVATISDPAGVLLFYTDGTTVWDSNHMPWPNTLPASPGGTLKGDASSTQSGVIVPKPMDANTYYIFAVDDNIGPNGLTFSRATMSANSGYGDIDLAEKNIQLMTPACEKITAVAHANGLDIWVIVHEWNSANFYVYIVTPAGFNYSAPVITNIGSVNSGSSAVTRGYSKASPGGGKIGVAIEGLDIYELFDFNTATGVLSNALTLTQPNFSDCYGIEFSSDEKLLYGSERWGYDLSQWNIGLATNAMIASSYTNVATIGSANGGALQLAPDLKIYLARSGKKYLGCINNPTMAGVGCNYVDEQVLLGPDFANAVQSREGLPTFIATFFNEAEFEFETSCDNDTTFFTIPNAAGLDMGYWNFNYPSTDPFYNRIDTSAEQYFIYPVGGVYTVELITERNGDYDTVHQDVYVSSYPIVNLGPDTVVCTNSIITYDLSFNDPFALDGQCDYFWEADLGTLVFYDSTATYLIDKPGTYTVTVNTDSICGSVTDSIIVIYNNVEADLGVDVTSGLCIGQSLTLDATYSNSSFGVTYYHWNQNQISPTINVTNSGTYSVTLTLGQCTSIDSVYVHFDSQLYSPLGADVNLCSGSSLILDAGNPGANYAWSTGVFSSTINVTNPGTYTVSVTNACGSIVDNIVINPLSIPAFDLGPDLTICQGTPEGISAFVDGATYVWSTGAIAPQIAVMSAGNYAVTVTNQCGSSSDAINVLTDIPLNNLDLGADTSVCMGFVLYAGYSDMDYYWSTNATSDSIIINSTDDYSLDITNECGTYTDYIHIDVIELEVDLGNDVTICPGGTATLNAGNPGAAYNWSNGAVTQSTSVNTAGTYSVIVTNLCESKSDTIVVSVFDTNLDLGSDTAICEGTVLELDAEHPGSTYFWSTGENTQTIEVDQVGTYSVTINHACGSLNDVIDITLNPSPIVDFGADTIFIPENANVTLNPGITGTSYHWSTGASTPTIIANNEGYYYVTVTDEYGCEGTGEVFLQVLWGISQPDENNSVLLYPNPTRDILYISLNNINAVEVNIFSAIGKLVRTYNLDGDKIIVDTNSMPEGVYFVKLITKEGEYIVRPFSILR